MNKKTLSSRSKDAFELNKGLFQADQRKIFKQIKGRFSSRSKDDFKLIKDDCKLIKRTIYKQMSKPWRAETEVICNQEL